MDSPLFRYTLFVLGGAGVLILWLRQKLYPKPYPGIPYNLQSATRMTGDIPDLIPVIKAKNEFSESLFTITTQKLGVPVAQMLFPGIRRPMIILEDPREIEDILLRRAKEFDKAPMSIDLFGPMFPNSTLAQYTTPELRDQKRIWADTMKMEFLRKTAAPNIRKSTLDLIELWRLKASIAPDQPFRTLDDFKYAALDAIWVAAVGEEPGVTRFEIKKLRSQISGNSQPQDQPLGAFIMKEVVYISDTIARNSSSPSPKWAQVFETWTPRYRRSRTVVNTEVGRSLRRAVDRFQGFELGKLERDDFDTCMIDLVLRRQILEARKAGKSKTSKDPTKDQSLIDMLFVMLVAVCIHNLPNVIVLLSDFTYRAMIRLPMFFPGFPSSWKPTLPFKPNCALPFKRLSMVPMRLHPTRSSKPTYLILMVSAKKPSALLARPKHNSAEV